MNIREMRLKLGITQSEFATRYHIPFRTIQNWETGLRTPPRYVLELLERNIHLDLINRKTMTLPSFNPQKKNLPKRSEYVGALAWLKAVRDCLGDSIVFALDDALMCQGIFGGRSEEYIVWVYGDDVVSKYNGVVLLGNQINKSYVKEKEGLFYTDFNRTLSDSFANEGILDMQGITEAVSRYYFKNGESFSGIYVEPNYQEKFEKLAEDAICYYDN